MKKEGVEFVRGEDCYQKMESEVNTRSVGGESFPLSPSTAVGAPPEPEKRLDGSGGVDESLVLY